MSDLKITYRDIDELKPSPSNPRTHSKQQIAALRRSIREFGFLNPVLTQKDCVVAGHGRLMAAKEEGMKQVPTVAVDHLTPTLAKAYLITDNRIAELAGWDAELLKAELHELSFNLDFDITLTGFATPDLDLLLPPATSKKDDKAAKEAAAVAANRSEPAVSRQGDLWRIGDHLVLCGDSTDGAFYRALMGNEAAGLVFTDAPYNVPVAGHVSGLGQHTHPEFAMASGEMDEGQFAGFLKTVFQHLVDHSRDGSLHYLCMDWRHMWEIMSAARGTYTSLNNLCVWAKTNGGMGSLYRSRHELVFVYKNGTAPHVNNVELGKHGRNRTNVWEYAGANAFGATRDTDLAMHPTVKPLEMVADAIMDTSNRDDIVLDAFGGSGTTLEAAHQRCRRGRAIEIDPYYVDLIVRRMQKATGEKATLVGDGDTFDTIKAWRRTGLGD